MLLQAPLLQAHPWRQHRALQQACTCRAASADLPPKKAAALIIGNEILTGSVVDTNTSWLAKLLFK